jgi:hypothetical protein
MSEGGFSGGAYIEIEPHRTPSVEDRLWDIEEEATDIEERLSIIEKYLAEGQMMMEQDCCELVESEDLRWTVAKYSILICTIYLIVAEVVKFIFSPLV